MNCRQARDEWHDACDAGTDPAPHIDAHMHECEKCRMYVRQMSSIVHALDGLHDATEEIVSVGAARRRDVLLSRPVPQWRRIFSTSMRVAAVLAMVITAGLYLRPGPEDQHSPVIQPQTVPIQRASLELRGRSATKYLAVHVDQRVPNDEPVDVIWLYRMAPPQPEPGEAPQSLIQVPRKEKRS